MLVANGMTWEYVDENMDIPRFAALTKYWEMVPPASLSLAMIASGLGIRLPSRGRQPTLEAARAEAAALNRGQRG